MAWAHVASVQGSGAKPYRICVQTVGEEHGKFGCSCPAWTRGKHRREDCKHIIATRDALVALLRNPQTRRNTKWGDTRRVEFAGATAADLFRALLEHGIEGVELDDITKMAVLAESAAGAWRLPIVEWAV